MTNKELLLEVRHDVKVLNTKVDILSSQDLHRRLSAAEEWQSRAAGRMDLIVRGIPLLSATLAILATVGGWLIIGGT